VENAILLIITQELHSLQVLYDLLLSVFKLKTADFGFGIYLKVVFITNFLQEMQCLEGGVYLSAVNMIYMYRKVIVSKLCIG